MPDAIVIADSMGIKYINEEAWKLLMCYTNDVEAPQSSFSNQMKDIFAKNLLDILIENPKQSLF